MEKLFSYGTLQFKKVQQDTFGRILNGKKDILRAYKLKDLIIRDENVINSSGINTHPIIYYTGYSIRVLGIKNCRAYICIFNHCPK